MIKFPKPIVFGIMSIGLAVSSCKAGQVYDDVVSSVQQSTAELKEAIVEDDAGTAEQQYQKGLNYTAGIGVEKDYVIATRWFKGAAELGHREAAFFLGSSYSNGRGIEQDHELAAHWLEKSANAGQVTAQLMIGDIYMNGRGVAKDQAWAARWYEKSAIAGNNRAMYMIGVAYASGLGINKDYRKSLLWLMLSSNYDYKDAPVLRDAIAGKLSGADQEQVEKHASNWQPITSAPFLDLPTVIYLQQTLNDLGYPAGAIDGLMGSTTRKAVDGYGRDKKLEVTEITQSLLEALRDERAVN